MKHIFIIFVLILLIVNPTAQHYLVETQSENNNGPNIYLIETNAGEGNINTEINNLIKDAKSREYEGANDEKNVSDEYIYEGDMVLDNLQIHELKMGLISGTIGGIIRYGNETKKVHRYNALINKKSRWPHNTLLYSFDSKVPKWKKNKIYAALSELHKKTGGCVKFNEINVGKRAVVTTEINVCQAQVGYKKWWKTTETQFIKLGPRCMQKGTIQHEFLHALGIYHTQSRSDRDKYVKIFKHNVRSGESHNFNKYDKNTVKHFGLSYDYSSIMHYGPRTFGKNGKITVQAIDRKKQHLLGNRKYVSKGDIQLIQHMYGCENTVKVLKSRGGTKYMYPELMGTYRVIQGKHNRFPIYKQEDGPGFTYVDSYGNWVVGKNTLKGISKMYSGKRPVLSSPPATKWFYRVKKKWKSDSTLTMVSSH